MTTLYVTEYEDLAQTAFNNIARAPELVNQTVSVTASSVSSSAFNKRTRVVRLHADTTCCIEIGAVVSAATSGASARMSANQTEYYAVPPGAGFQVAVVAST